MKSGYMLIALGVTLICLCTVSVWAQGSTSAAQPSGPSAPSASQGSATIENQMIAYEVLRQMAQQIADRVKVNCHCSTVVLPDPNSQSEIITAKAFDVSANALVDAYGAIGHGVQRPTAPIEAFAAPTLSDIGTLLTAIKSSAAYSNQNFQPTTQSMITLLSAALNGEQIAVRTANLPGNLDLGVKAVQGKIGDIESAQRDAGARIQHKQKEEDQKQAEREKNDKDMNKEAKDREEAAHKAALADIAADKAALADLDKEFSGLRTALSGTSADGTVLATVIKGKALLSSAPYSLLTVSVDGAGGDTKVTHFFWQELIMPTPSPSYNGGAVVSFLLTDQNANYQDADIFHYMYDFSKWKSSKVPKTFNSDAHLQRPVAGSVPPK